MYKIVSIPGDGIGPEVVAGAVAVMNRLSEKHGFAISIEEHPFGGASYDLHGEMLTEETLKACRNCDAVLLGAVGGGRNGRTSPTNTSRKPHCSESARNSDFSRT